MKGLPAMHYQHGHLCPPTNWHVLLQEPIHIGTEESLCSYSYSTPTGQCRELSQYRSVLENEASLSNVILQYSIEQLTCITLSLPYWLMIRTAFISSSLAGSPKRAMIFSVLRLIRSISNPCSNVRASALGTSMFCRSARCLANCMKKAWIRALNSADRRKRTW